MTLIVTPGFDCKYRTLEKAILTDALIEEV